MIDASLNEAATTIAPTRPLWVAFDIDGTLGCARPALRVALADRLGLPVDAIREGGPYEQFGFTTGCGRTDIALSGMAQREWEQVAAQAAPLPGALEAVTRVEEAGRLLGYASRRPVEMLPVSQAWLLQHGFPLERRMLRHAYTPHVCKSALVAELAMRLVGESLPMPPGGLDWADLALVEDSGREALSAARNGVRVYLLDQHHNQDAQHPLITRIPDLSHLPLEIPA